jgi:Domain of unknown function (DUF4920)
MLKNFLVVLSLAALAVACSKKTNEVTGGQHFGAATTAKNAITYDALVTKMQKADSLQAKVTGKISEVCLKKGCWMTMVSETPGQPEMRVTFKNYAFFMPKDIVGKKVIIDGFSLVETTSVADQRHYAEDGGMSKAEIEKITTPKRELTFEAAGVIILN